MKRLFATFFLWVITGYGYDFQKATVATDFSWNNNSDLLSGDGMPSVSAHRFTSCEKSRALVFATGKPLVNTSATPVHFSEHLIADEYAYAYGITAADFDNDGDLDLSSGDCNPHNMLYLFQNNAHGSFTRSFVQKNDPERLERHMAGDVDNDGDLDIVIVKNLHGDLVWFENAVIPSTKRWNRHVITVDLPGAYDVALADFDLDGDLDVAASSWRLGNQFAWFENDGTPKNGEWTIRAADFDQDGDMDLLGTARLAGQVIWYENEQKDLSISWKKHPIDTQSVCPAHGNPVDMDQDGDLDVVIALGFYYHPSGDRAGASLHRKDNQIVWYENNGQPAAGSWEKHVIQPMFDDAFEAVAGDLDGDGDMDVVATSWRLPGRVAWFENMGDSRAPWRCHLLKENWRSANQVLIADLNGDGRLDIVACAERGSNELRWWRNEGPSDQP